MVTAIPAVKPTVMVLGTYLIRVPSLKTPISIRIIPAIREAIISPDIPLVATIPATTVAKAAVGPAICTVLPPRSATIKIALIAV